MYLKNISKAKIKLDTKIVIIKQKPTAGVKKQIIDVPKTVVP